MRLGLYSSNPAGPAAQLLARLLTAAGHRPVLRDHRGFKTAEWEYFDGAVVVVSPGLEATEQALTETFEARERPAVRVTALTEEDGKAVVDADQLTSELEPLCTNDAIAAAVLPAAIAALAAASQPAEAKAPKAAKGKGK